jgi:CRISPR-associated protein Csm1
LLNGVADFVRLAGQLEAEFVERCVPQIWQQDCVAVVKRAERLAAGRRTGHSGRNPAQLTSIFCYLEAEGQHVAHDAHRYWPLKPLAMEESVLFLGEKQDKAGLQTAYGDLWRQFSHAAMDLKQAHEGHPESLPTYVESLLLLLQRYTWCIPSAYSGVSVYDHSRVTAALATCLGDLPDGGNIALLVGGDISGVQDFIYPIVASRATSALRGRSFYLQLLTEAIARFVLRELDLPITNLI